MGYQRDGLNMGYRFLGVEKCGIAEPRAFSKTQQFSAFLNV
jgi:hypothetical protein